MSHQLGIPKAALNSLIQMVDHNAQIKPGMEVVILAHIDGLYGSNNLVDEQAVSWAQAVVQSRGANCSILWIDEIMKVHEWRMPPVAKGAITEANVLINTSLDLAIEEVAEFRKYIEDGEDLVCAHVSRHRPAPDDRVGPDAARARDHDPPRELQSFHDPHGQVCHDRPQRHAARRLHARSGAAPRHPRHAL